MTGKKITIVPFPENLLWVLCFKGRFGSLRPAALFLNKKSLYERGFLFR